MAGVGLMGAVRPFSMAFLVAVMMLQHVVFCDNCCFCSQCHVLLAVLCSVHVAVDHESLELGGFGVACTTALCIAAAAAAGLRCSRCYSSQATPPAAVPLQQPSCSQGSCSSIWQIKTTHQTAAFNCGQTMPVLLSYLQLVAHKGSLLVDFL
jgi:hypothetical protein